MKSKPKVGLALGGGAARGLAYIGILKVLEKHKIHIDYIAGTSIGAVVGALYASGYSSKELEQIVKDTKWKELFEVSDFQLGLIQQTKIQNYLTELFKGKKFEDLKIPLAVTTIDIKAGREVVFDSGNLVKAVNASMSIPGLFTPVKINHRNYLDGGIIDPVPVGVLNRKKIPVTIAVDLSIPIERYKFSAATDPKEHPILVNFIEKTAVKLKKHLKVKKILPTTISWAFNPKKIVEYFNEPPSEIFRISAKSFHILTSELAKSKLKEHKPSVVIRPDLDDVGLFDFHKLRKCIKKGELAAQRHIGEIEKLAKV